jgi:hypothetical protein
MYNCNSDKAMPIAIAPLLGAGLGALQQSKLQKAQEGTKVYTKPKTFIGKLIGGVSGRSAAADLSASVKTAPISDQVYNSLVPNEAPTNMTDRQSIPVSGGISFGGEAVKRSYLPFYLGAVLVAIFFFMRRKGGRRRR